MEGVGAKGKSRLCDVCGHADCETHKGIVQMTEQEWRRVLWWHDEWPGWVLTFLLIGSGAGTIFGTIAGITTANKVQQNQFAWITLILLITFVLCTLKVVGMASESGLARLNAARLYADRVRRKKVAAEEQEKQLRAEALKELITDTGLGLGETMWQRVSAWKEEDPL